MYTQELFFPLDMPQTFLKQCDPFLALTHLAMVVLGGVRLKCESEMLLIYLFVDIWNNRCP